ncbi:hypothetical protein [Syntrophobotulus glycolicus]|nr:hypothetical protein [Syntrophobotulus glycolicus]
MEGRQDLCYTFLAPPSGVVGGSGGFLFPGIAPLPVLLTVKI